MFSRPRILSISKKGGAISGELRRERAFVSHLDKVVGSRARRKMQRYGCTRASTSADSCGVTVTQDGHKNSHAGGHRPNATATEIENEIEKPGYGQRGAGLRRDACRRHLWLTSSGATWSGSCGYIPGDRHGRAGEHYRKRADSTPIRNAQFVGGAPPSGRLARYPFPQPAQPGEVRERQGTRQEQCAHERYDNRR
jgi:hypothetical protein